MQLRIKRLRGELPRYHSDGAAGIDLAYQPENGKPLLAAWRENFKVSTGIALEIPEGYVGLVLPRSSMRDRIDYFHPGVIDSDFVGEVQLCFRPSISFILEAGQRIAQLVIVPCPRFEIVEADELRETARGERGFGSSGR